MKRSLRNISILCLALYLGGCVTDTVKPNELEGYKRKMVVNAVVNAGKSIELELTTSEAAIDSNLSSSVEDATVQLTTESGVEIMPYDIFIEKYTTTTAIGAGKSMNIIVSHPDFPSARSTIALPRAINATGNLIEDGGIDTSGLTGDLLQVSFDDVGGKQNYYKINVYYFLQSLSEWIPLDFDKTDPSLSAINSFKLNDAGVLFSDELFDGKRKTISIVAPSGIVAGNTTEKYRIELSSITNDFYKYFSSLQRARDAKEITYSGGYNNAVVIHSNIEGGLGILGAQTSSEILLK
ncbi:MAG: DUF4249 domain-containing protein [Bacteroidia bacterium]